MGRHARKTSKLELKRLVLFTFCWKPDGLRSHLGFALFRHFGWLRPAFGSDLSQVGRVKKKRTSQKTASADGDQKSHLRLAKNYVKNACLTDIAEILVRPRIVAFLRGYCEIG